VEVLGSDLGAGTAAILIEFSGVFQSVQANAGIAHDRLFQNPSQFIIPQPSCYSAPYDRATDSVLKYPSFPNRSQCSIGSRSHCDRQNTYIYTYTIHSISMRFIAVIEEMSGQRSK
jgi:hypothetical protein